MHCSCRSCELVSLATEKICLYRVMTLSTISQSGTNTKSLSSSWQNLDILFGCVGTKQCLETERLQEKKNRFCIPFSKKKKKMMPYAKSVMLPMCDVYPILFRVGLTSRSPLSSNFMLIYLPNVAVQSQRNVAFDSPPPQPFLDIFQSE